MSFADAGSLLKRAKTGLLESPRTGRLVRPRSVFDDRVVATTTIRPIEHPGEAPPLGGANHRLHFTEDTISPGNGTESPTDWTPPIDSSSWRTTGLRFASFSGECAMQDEANGQALLEEKGLLQDLFSRIASDLSDRFFGSGTPDESTDALQQVLDTTRGLLEAEKCALFLVDLPRRSLSLERASGAVQFDRLKDVGTYGIENYDPATLGTGVTPWVWYRKQPFNARSFQELVSHSEGHWKGNWDEAMYDGRENAEVDFKCVYMVPLLAGDDCIGVLKYENRTGGQQNFSDSEERVIDMIGALVTNLVVAQRIERNRYDQILPTISEILVSSFGQSSFYDRLLEQCRQILSADLSSLFLVDTHGDLVLQAIVGIEGETERRNLADFKYENYKSSSGLTPWILRTGRSFNVRNYPDLQARSEGNHLGRWDKDVYHGRPEVEFKSLYSIPLIIGDNRIGVLKVENKNVPPFYFTESDETLFDLIGRLIAIGAIYDDEKHFGALVRGAELGFLAAGVSHEFGTFLGRFAFRVGILDKHIVGNPKATSDLAGLQAMIRRAELILDRFRSVRYRQEGTQPFDPGSIVDDVLGFCRDRFTRHNIDVRYNNEEITEVSLNPADFQTILINLMKNAFESIGEENRGVVEVTLRRSGEDRLCLAVEDSGRGLTEDDIDHVFLPFFSTKAPVGMGFGLFSVQRIVEANGGQIKTVGHGKLGGASFEVTLPLSLDTTRGDA